MGIEKLERILYLIRNNLYWTDEDGFLDWRDAKVESIVNDEIILQKDGEFRSWNLDDLEAKCEALCDEHFEMLEAYLEKQLERKKGA